MGAFEAVAPRGTHHTVLTVTDENGPDRTEACSALRNGPDMIFGSGVGTGELEFPDGVAVRIEGGRQLLLNLHLFNTTGERIEGRSGIRAQLATVGEVEHEAQIVLAGNETFQIPARMRDLVVEGDCTMTENTTIFAIFPHMHQFGTRMRVEAVRGAERSVLHDDFYSFDAQQYTTLGAPLAMTAGDRVEVRCTYDNNTDRPVTFGDSSEAEMCYAGLYRYPPVDNPQGISCTR